MNLFDSLGNLVKGAAKAVNPLSVVGDVVGGVANVASTAMTNHANAKAAEQQNEWNIEQWNREADFTREMWNANNEYNDPTKQMKRLTDAGLSPWAAASVMGAGDSSMVSTPSGKPAAGATMQAPNFQFIGDAVQRGIDNFLSNEMKAAEVEKKKNEAKEAGVNADMQQAYYDKFWSDYMHEGLQQLMLGNRRTAKGVALDMQALEQNEGRFILEQGLMRQEQKQRENQIEFGALQNYAQKVENKMNDIRLKSLPVQIKAEIALKGAQTFAAMQAGYYSQAEAKHEFWKQCETILRSAGISETNRYMQAVNDLNILGTKFDIGQKAIQFLNSNNDFEFNSWQHKQRMSKPGKLLHSWGQYWSNQPVPFINVGTKVLR